jgi:hypothetical protein
LQQQTRSNKQLFGHYRPNKTNNINFGRVALSSPTNPIANLGNLYPVANHDLTDDSIVPDIFPNYFFNCINVLQRFCCKRFLNKNSDGLALFVAVRATPQSLAINR